VKVAEPANDTPKKRRYPSALLATVPATLLAAIPLAAGVDGRLHPPTTCEGGICTLSEIFFYVAPVVWIGTWGGVSLLIWGLRKAAVAAERRRAQRAGLDAG
jgi:hypothetical protein